MRRFPWGKGKKDRRDEKLKERLEQRTLDRQFGSPVPMLDFGSRARQFIADKTTEPSATEQARINNVYDELDRLFYFYQPDESYPYLTRDRIREGFGTWVRERLERFMLLLEGNTTLPATYLRELAIAIQEQKNRESAAQYTGMPGSVIRYEAPAPAAEKPIPEGRARRRFDLD